MPDSDEVDLDELVERIKSDIDVEDTDREPVAFGLEALMILVKVEDEEGVLNLSKIRLLKWMELTL